ncbi:transmembrane protein 241 isoform X2 [Hypomesus transpacificus]|uniref:transmembrane protein 241 isoform X2 n=2 Tax=Hypomesus transpacificus TaxID=137520 RepID=UPI001F085FCF|nr:transmembrane protein 241 isoform X2 [Hypomesus transpacificus]
MHWKKHVTGLTFCFFFVPSYFTNKYVLSVLKFTYPTLFQGWQTLIGVLLLLLSGKLGWVEMSSFSRSAALSWLPGSLLFVGNIYAGSRALACLPIAFFFTLHNASEVVYVFMERLIKRDGFTEISGMKVISVSVVLLSAVSLPLHDPQFDQAGYTWGVIHLCSLGAYRVFQTHFKPNHLSVLLLVLAAHPTGDLFGAWKFPFLLSLRFQSGCCASALLGFFLLLATVKLKSGLASEQCNMWIFLSKVMAICLSPFVFISDVNTPSLACVVFSHIGEVLLVYSDRILR